MKKRRKKRKCTGQIDKKRRMRRDRKRRGGGGGRKRERERERRGVRSVMAADVSHVFSQQKLWLQQTPLQPKHQGSSCFRSAFRGKHLQRSDNHPGDSSSF